MVDALTDNNSALQQARRGTTRHAAYERGLGVRTSLLRDLEERQFIALGRVPTKTNRGNLGTKALGRLDLQGEKRLSGIVKKKDIPEVVQARFRAREERGQGCADKGADTSTGGSFFARLRAQHGKNVIYTDGESIIDRSLTLGSSCCS